MTPEQFLAWREMMGLTRSEAAKRLGLSYSTLENYEKGHRKGEDTPVVIPDSIALACAALALGVERYEGGVEIILANRAKRSRL